MHCMFIRIYTVFWHSMRETVAAQAGGYTQANLDPAVMVVHLAAGLAQCLGQLINIWAGGLPVVVITFAGDTGSFADRIELDLSHDFGPTSIAAPSQALHRALLVAKTPPVGTGTSRGL